MPVLACKRFINNGDLLTLGVIRLGEHPPSLQRGLQDIEVARTYAGHFSDRYALRFRGAIFDNESALIPPRAVHGKTGSASNGRLLDAGEPADAAQDFLIKRRALLGHAIGVLGRIIRKWQPYFGRQKPVRLEAWPHLKKMPEASQEQARADKEHEGESDFRGNQYAQDSYLVLARSGAPAAFPEIASLVRTHRLQRGHQAENNARQDRDEECE